MSQGLKGPSHTCNKNNPTDQNECAPTEQCRCDDCVHQTNENRKTSTLTYHTKQEALYHVQNLIKTYGVYPDSELGTPGEPPLEDTGDIPRYTEKHKQGMLNVATQELRKSLNMMIEMQAKTQPITQGTQPLAHTVLTTEVADEADGKQELQRTPAAIPDETVAKTIDPQDWMIYPRIFDRYNKQMGPFDLDAACDKQGKNSMCDQYWSKEDDLTTQDWSNKNSWCNLPFNIAFEGLTRFLECKKEHPDNTAATFVIPAWPGTTAWDLAREFFELVDYYPPTVICSQLRP